MASENPYPNAPPPTYPGGSESYQQQPPYSQPYSASPYSQPYSSGGQPYGAPGYPGESYPHSQPPASERFGTQPYQSVPAEENSDFNTAGAFTEKSIRAGTNITFCHRYNLCNIICTLIFLFNCEKSIAFALHLLVFVVDRLRNDYILYVTVNKTKVKQNYTLQNWIHNLSMAEHVHCTVIDLIHNNVTNPNMCEGSFMHEVNYTVPGLPNQKLEIIIIKS